MSIGNVSKLNDDNALSDPILEVLRKLYNLFPSEYNEIRIKAYSEDLTDMKIDPAHLKKAVKYLTEFREGFPSKYDIVTYLKQNNWIPEENERLLKKQEEEEIERIERKRLFDLEARDAELQNQKYSEGSKETNRLRKLRSRVMILITEGWEGTLTGHQFNIMKNRFGDWFRYEDCFRRIEISAENAYRNDISKSRWIGNNFNDSTAINNLYKSGNQNLEPGSFWRLLEENRTKKGLPEINVEKEVDQATEIIDDFLKRFR